MPMLKEPSLRDKTNHLDIHWENTSPTVGTWEGSSRPKLGSREGFLEALTPKHSPASHSFWSRVILLCYILLGQWMYSWGKAPVTGLSLHLDLSFRATVKCKTPSWRTPCMTTSALSSCKRPARIWVSTQTAYFGFLGLSQKVRSSLIIQSSSVL